MCHFLKDVYREDKVDGILFQEGAVNINNLPFRKHNDREKAHEKMPSRCKVEIGRDDKKGSEGGPDLDLMAQQV